METTTKKWYTHQTEPIKEDKGASILKEFAVQTDRKIKRNRLDIVVKNYKRKTFSKLYVSVNR